MSKRYILSENVSLRHSYRLFVDDDHVLDCSESASAIFITMQAIEAQLGAFDVDVVLRALEQVGGLPSPGPGHALESVLSQVFQYLERFQVIQPVAPTSGE